MNIIPEIDFRALPTMMLYCIADEYKRLALDCEEPRFLVKAKALETLAGQREFGSATLEMEVCA
ncbi:hypothetical protein [Anaeroselena agilis]|uniref:Uncharacterized protein n=1 Tax=Anaeroselena agilis TaxID=3063788 RepID=A0ABU3NZ43_9FIRM|nr:hypothetical protein [Selenomonadales bacterium 4137-cl]